MRARVSLGIFFFSLFPGLYAQYNFNERCAEAYIEVINLRFGIAGKIIREEQVSDPANLVPVYLEDFSDFIRLFISEDRDLYRNLKSQGESRRKQLSKGNQYSPYHRFFLGEHHLQWALIRFRFGDYTSGALDMRQAWQYIEENNRLHPDFMPNHMVYGVIRVMLSLVPEQYQWITDLLGIRGDMKEGLVSIHRVAVYQGDNSIVRLYQPEALFYLALISANLKQEKRDALALISIFEKSDRISAVRNSQLITFARASIALRNNRNDLALQILTSTSKDTTAYPFHFLDFMRGLALLYKTDFTAAIFFQKYLNEFSGINYKPAAMQRLAWIALLEGDSAQYYAYMERIRGMAPTVVDEDKQARRDAEKGEIPSPLLLRVRLLFDGGYYQEALRVLINHPVHEVVRNRKDLVEYTYRMGRIYHESGQIDKAIAQYESTMERGRNEPYYFAANSALQLGLIYESRGEMDLAAKAFRDCLSMKPEEYRSSLEMKAKAGLNRVLSGR